MRNKSAFFYSSIMIGVLLVFLSISYVYNAYQGDRNRVIDRLESNASFVDLWLSKSFFDSSLVLKDMVEDLSKNGVHSINDNSSEHHSELLYLREKEDALPNAVLAFIIDEKCRLTHSKTLSGLDLSHREYCEVFKSNKNQEVIVTLPFYDLNNRNVVVQGRKVVGDDGSFAGMVGISTNLSFFSSTINHLRLPESMGISILSSNLKLLASVPKMNSLIGQTINISKVAPSVFEELYLNGEVVFDSDIYDDGKIDTIYARKVKDLPFIVVITKQQDYWETMFSLSLLSIIACFFAITALLLFNVRYVKRTKEQKDKYSELAYNDYLTGINNRRSFELKAAQVLAEYRRKKVPFSIIMCDIDNFKEYNDKYGHDIGDRMIMSFAEACLVNLRDSDILGRFGGDEFVIVVPEQNDEQALLVAHKLQRVIRNLSVIIDDEELSMTCSMGISTISDPQMTIQELLSIADERLYNAKKSGRNCVKNN